MGHGPVPALQWLVSEAGSEHVSKRAALESRAAENPPQAGKTTGSSMYREALASGAKTIV